ncbi:MAG: PKD domain-containing protein, partial [Candidatus Lutacidiplasmatales archaeon]
GMLNDTWLFANRTWSPISTTSAPSPRFGAGLDFDVRLQSILLFGGFVVPNSPYQLNDTWALGAAGWSPISFHGSPPRVGLGDLWWDARSNTTWLYGGAADNPTNSTVVLGAETEAIDLLTANASIDGTDGITPFTLRLTSEARFGEGPYQYAWTVPGGIVTTPNGTWTVDTVGVYTVYLNITDAWGVAWQTTFPLTISPGPLQVSFTAAPNLGTAPVTVAFAANAAGGSAPYTFAWNFGDGTTAAPSATPNATHLYVANQTFMVLLTVASGAGPNGTSSQTITLQSFAFPGPFDVAASVTPLFGPPPLNITFVASATNGTPPYRYAWSFGDGAAATAANGSHLYTGLGQYTVGLNVTDANVIIVHKTFTVDVRANVPGTTPAPNPKSAGFAGLPWWVWGLVAALVLAGIVSAVVLLRRGRGSGGEGESR